MDLFKGKILGKYLKPKTEKRADKVTNPGNGDLIPPSSVSEVEEEEEEEDDFVAQEIKRRLRELKRNGCMGLIPEGDGEEEEEDVDVFPWRRFCDNFYRKYCDQMLFFEKIIIAHHRCHKEDIPAADPRFNRAVSRYRFLSFKNKGSQLAEESQRLCEQGGEGEDDFGNLEAAYVAHLALTWEALHCQHSLLKQRIEEEEGHVISYGSVAEAFQQFQVLLHRFVENEPFEPGSRVQIYSRARMAMPKLLQVPSLRGVEVEAEGEDPRVRGVDFLKVVEDSVLVFRHFLKAEKTKPASRSVGLPGCAAALQQARLSLSKREMKLKELLRKRKKKKRKVSSSWPGSVEDVDLLFGLIDLRVVSRVLRMARISKEQMLWCEEKMGKLGFFNGKLHRDGAPLLFPS